MPHPPRPGRRLTITDIVELTGLSKATVSRAINDTAGVAPATRDWVRSVVDEQGYTPTRTASMLSRGRTGLIGVMIGETRYPVGMTTIEASVDAAGAAGFRTVVSVTATPKEHSEAYGEILGGRMVDGALVLFARTADIPVLAELSRSGLPIVAIEPERPIPGVTCVYADSREDFRLATEHLLGLGHLRIGVCLDVLGWGEQDRAAIGYRAALAGVGIDVDQGLVVRAGWDFEAGRRAVWQWRSLRRPATAGIFICDVSALGGISALRDAKLDVPGDFSVISYDDSALARWHSPAITTLEDRRLLLARRACSILIERIKDPAIPPSKHRVRTQLAPRQSTGRAGAARDGPVNNPADRSPTWTLPVLVDSLRDCCSS